jgi:hypothetical protein
MGFFSTGVDGCAYERRVRHNMPAAAEVRLRTGHCRATSRGICRGSIDHGEDEEDGVIADVHEVTNVQG